MQAESWWSDQNGCGQVESCFRAKEVELVMEFRKICRRVTAVGNYPVDVTEGSVREFSSFEQLQTLLQGPPSPSAAAVLRFFYSW